MGLISDLKEGVLRWISLVCSPKLTPERQSNWELEQGITHGTVEVLSQTTNLPRFTMTTKSNDGLFIMDDNKQMSG